MLVDRAMDIGSAEYRGAGFGWQSATGFPSFFQRLHRREGAYAAGFEPSTHPVTGDQAARDDGTMTWLATGESRTYATTFRILEQSA